MEERRVQHEGERNGETPSYKDERRMERGWVVVVVEVKGRIDGGEKGETRREEKWRDTPSYKNERR